MGNNTELSAAEIRLIDYYTDNQSPEQRAETERMLGDDASFRELAEKVQREVLFLGWDGVASRIDGQQALAKVRTEWTRSQRRKRLSRISRYAAVLIIPILAASLYIWFGPGAEPVLPGDTKALLITSAGNKIELSDTPAALIDEIAYDEHGILNYAVATREEPTMQIDSPALNTLIIPRAGQYSLVLPDGTRVWLNSESTLRYPTRFSGTREVELTGEAYFEVAEDADRRFVVRSGEFELTVYGTQFNVNTHRPQQIRVVLVEGSVGFSTDGHQAQYTLAPGQEALIDYSQEQRVNIRAVDTYAHTAWKDNSLVFHNETLGNILEDVCRWYDVEATFEHEALKDLRFSADLPRDEDIRTLMSLIEKTSGKLSIELKNRTLTVRNRAR